MRELALWLRIFSWAAPLGACVLFSCPARSQENASDSDFSRASVSRAISLYHQSIGDQSAILNGMRYPGYFFQFHGGTPFFNSGKADTGWVYYDSIMYTDLSIYFDDLSQVVIIDDNGYKIQVNNRKLDEFGVAGHHFIRLEKKVRNWGELDPGFYELLYAGGIRILKKTVKRAVDDISEVEIAEKSITVSDHFYIEKDSVAYLVGNTKEFEKAIPGKKREIARFIRQHKLSFRENPENVLLQLASFFDPLHDQPGK